MLKTSTSPFFVGKIKIKIEKEEREVEVGRGKKIAEIMKDLGLILDEYVAILNGEVVTELEEVKPGDRLEFIRVWSGG